MNQAEQARWRRAKEIFEQACDTSGSAQRRIVEELAGGDETLAADVNRLLAMQLESGLTLDRPAQPLSFGMHPPGAVLCDRYRIDRYLASGGMGDVYAATDLRSGERVAVKFVRPFATSQQETEARFVREVRLAQKIDHPNVCRMMALETHNGVRFCVMELLQGETLADRLKQCGRLTAEQALPVALQACDALDAAHKAGVLHRDVKPGNIFLVGERVLLIDFGLAAAVLRDASLTSVGVVIGTLAYVAPEQLEQNKAGAASDLYSLGVVLHEMLTGRKPHDAKSPFRLARQKTSEMHEAISRSREIPPVWAEVLTRCLKARPEQRYGSAEEVRAALVRPRPSVRYRLARPLVWVPALALLLAMCGWLGWRWAHADYMPAPDAVRLYDDAVAAVVQSSPARAVQLLERAVRRDPRFVKALALLAVAHAETDQLDKAGQAILQATIVADGRPMLGRGERLALDAARAAVVRDFPAAAEHYRLWSSLEAGRERGKALLLLGRMQNQGGHSEEAQATFELAVQEEPENIAARIRLAAQLCRRLQFSAAAAQFQVAEQKLRTRGNIEGLTELLLARAALRTQSPTQQLKDVEEAEDLSKRSGNRFHRLSVSFRRAAMALSVKDYDGAAAISRKTAEEARREGLLSVAAQAMGELGYAFVFAREFQRSLPVLETSISLAKQAGSHLALAQNRMRLGEAMGNLGRLEEAAASMQPAIEWYRQARFDDVLPLHLIKYGTVLTDEEQKMKHFREALQLASRYGQRTYETMALQRITARLYVTDLRQCVADCERLLPLARQSAHHGTMLQVAQVFGDAGQFDRAISIAAEVERALTEYPQGVDRVRFGRKIALVRAEVARMRGNCREGLGLLANWKIQPAETSHLAAIGRLEACSAASEQAVLEANLARWETRIGQTEAMPQAAEALAAAVETALRLKRWDAAKRIAKRGIAISALQNARAWELGLVLALRVAERRTGNGGAVEPLTERSRELARQVGFDDGYNGRKDLQALWRAGAE